MKLKNNYRNINKLHSLVQLLYFSAILLAIFALIAPFSIPFIPNSNILFEKSIYAWVYSARIPLHIGTAAFIVEGSIPRYLLAFLPIDMINIRPAIIVHYLISMYFPNILAIIALKKTLALTTDVINKETPFQLKHVKSLRHFSCLILLYSTLGNTLLCVLNSIFVVDFFYIEAKFSWLGILIGIMGYILSDILKYGLFLQYEYDTTL